MLSVSERTLKLSCLVLLTFITTSTVLLMRYSRTEKVPQHYLPSTAVFLAEVIKVITCVCVLYIEEGYDVEEASATLYHGITDWNETFKLIIPSAMYTLQNNLLFIALSNLDAPTYQVTYQLKILTTAIFSVMLLGRKLKTHQWVSLVLLMIGVALVQIPNDSSKSETHESAKKRGSLFLGLMSVFIASFSSGFAGVYFERLVKFGSHGGGSVPRLSIRNIQMGIFGVLFGAIAMLYSDYYSIRQGGMLQGYNLITWSIIALQAFGGLVIAVTIKYADNILKGFSTSFSIILSSLCSYFLLNDLDLSNNFILGSFLVICATFFYGCKFNYPEKEEVLQQKGMELNWGDAR
ncbi:unnamed protein product [Darwinula stevensoni]|uniref:UDP-N-acetylglucosamine transporter n=1 Tax=Darwinula stevensoni TaxID=69355 RepID=A0A7R9A0K7_9CRUS|nr:unnamed protein product [Darwinula stevensoni]CAG0884782.1 unnamed protein product [Darwinula stevensoni]